jgi:glutamate dehydrogenase
MLSQGEFGHVTVATLRTELTYTFSSRIDELYLDNATPGKCYRLETYRSTGPISATAHQQLRCYFVTKCNFPTNPPPSRRTDGKTDILTVADPVFVEKATENTLEIYQGIMWNVEARYGPVIEVFEVEGTRERRLVIGYKMGGTTHFFSALSKLYHFYSLYSARKYVGASFTPSMLLIDHQTCARTILKWDHDCLDLP